MEQGTSQVKNNNFEEEVCVQKTSVAPDGAIIQCLQMRSAFWRGVTLLKESDSSEPDVGQHQGEPVAEAGPSTSAEAFSELPKHVILLKPVIGKLMDKVAHA
jgi:hypothetical protein